MQTKGCLLGPLQGQRKASYFCGFHCTPPPSPNFTLAHRHALHLYTEINTKIHTDSSPLLPHICTLTRSLVGLLTSFPLAALSEGPQASLAQALISSNPVLQILFLGKTDRQWVGLTFLLWLSLSLALSLFPLLLSASSKTFQMWANLALQQLYLRFQMITKTCEC